MSYNREGRAGAPKTLLGNWYEEYASRDGAAVAPPRELHFNTTNHDDFVKPTVHEGHVSTLGPRRRRLEAAWAAEANRRVAEAEAAGRVPAPQRYKTTAGASFGREEEPIARGLVRDNMGRADPNKGYLDDQPISLYTSANVPGKTAATGKNMFAKNAAFSSRVEDFYGGGEVKDL